MHTRICGGKRRIDEFWRREALLKVFHCAQNRSCIRPVEEATALSLPTAFQQDDSLGEVCMAHSLREFAACRARTVQCVSEHTGPCEVLVLHAALCRRCSSAYEAEPRSLTPSTRVD